MTINETPEALLDAVKEALHECDLEPTNARLCVGVMAHRISDTRCSYADGDVTICLAEAAVTTLLAWQLPEQRACPMRPITAEPQGWNRYTLDYLNWLHRNEPDTLRGLPLAEFALNRLNQVRRSLFDDASVDSNLEMAASFAPCLFTREGAEAVYAALKGKGL